MPKLPWTHEELAQLQRELDGGIEQTQIERPNVRPLPPMTEDEARVTLLGLTDAAQARTLTEDEAFMCGQLLAAYRQAVEARMLGAGKGRYFVIPEAQINAMIAKTKQP